MSSRGGWGHWRSQQPAASAPRLSARGAWRCLAVRGGVSTKGSTARPGGLAPCHLGNRLGSDGGVAARSGVPRRREAFSPGGDVANRASGQGGAGPIFNVKCNLVTRRTRRGASAVAALGAIAIPCLGASAGLRRPPPHSAWQAQRGFAIIISRIKFSSARPGLGPAWRHCFVEARAVRRVYGLRARTLCAHCAHTVRAACIAPPDQRPGQPRLARPRPGA